MGSTGTQVTRPDQARTAFASLPGGAGVTAAASRSPTDRSGYAAGVNRYSRPVPESSVRYSCRLTGSTATASCANAPSADAARRCLGLADRTRTRALRRLLAGQPGAPRSGANLALVRARSFEGVIRDRVATGGASTREDSTHRSPVRSAGAGAAGRSSRSLLRGLRPVQRYLCHALLFELLRPTTVDRLAVGFYRAARSLATAQRPPSASAATVPGGAGAAAGQTIWLLAAVPETLPRLLLPSNRR